MYVSPEVTFIKNESFFDVHYVTAALRDDENRPRDFGPVDFNRWLNERSTCHTWVPRSKTQT